ncbi:unnamed protein product [Closterium sp. NIES-64]|nr:unnamed protein product [Closterium sp. NIES-64]
MASLLERTEIGALVSEKREIISVPDSATVLDALEFMLHSPVFPLAYPSPASLPPACLFLAPLSPSLSPFPPPAHLPMPLFPPPLPLPLSPSLLFLPLSSFSLSPLSPSLLFLPLSSFSLSPLSPSLLFLPLSSFSLSPLSPSLLFLPPLSAFSLSPLSPTSFRFLPLSSFSHLFPLSPSLLFLPPLSAFSLSPLSPTSFRFPPLSSFSHLFPLSTSLLSHPQLMNANGIVALPVAAPPGKWLGAGGANIVDGDKHAFLSSPRSARCDGTADQQCVARGRERETLSSLMPSSLPPSSLPPSSLPPSSLPPSSLPPSSLPPSSLPPSSPSLSLLPSLPTRVPSFNFPSRRGVSTADLAMHLGVVSMADVAMHVVREAARPAALKAGVVSLIGNSPEGLSLWVASTSTPLVDAMEPLSKGIHRLLVRCPIAPPAAPSPAYAAPTAMTFATPPLRHLRLRDRQQQKTDVAAFLLLHVDALGDVAQRTVEQLGLADPLFPPLAIVSGITVTAALRLMQRAGGVRAVAVVAGSAEEEERMEEGEGSGAASAAGADVAGGRGGGGGGAGRGRERGEAGWVRGGRLLGTLSVSDLRGMDAETLAQLTSMKVRDFLAHMASLSPEGRRPSITCRMAAPLAEVMALAATNRVHRVWVTGEDDELLGVVSLTDVISACRRAGGHW